MCLEGTCDVLNHLYFQTQLLEQIIFGVYFKNFDRGPLYAIFFGESKLIIRRHIRRPGLITTPL